MPHFCDTCAGPIPGFYLPLAAWDVLDRENIRTIDELRDQADRLEQFDGLGSRMAQVIRQELAHVVSSNEQTSGQGQTDSWGA